MIQTGDTIGPYTFVRTLGRGAFGEVWLADRRTSLITTQVALKMPLVAENDIEAVRREAALWLQASGHPNIVPVLDAEVYDGQVVIASEFIAGGSLHDRIARTGSITGASSEASVEDAVRITQGILAGLDYLHRAGLTHRDLKPENVLLQDNIPRLTDFGLARVLKAAAQSEEIAGTPRYMAPETFSGSYSAASDLWSVGIILYELLAGGYPPGHPFPTSDLMLLIVAIQSQEPASLPDAIPERLRGIVACLLAKSSDDRFASASAVREALQKALQQDAPVFAPTASASTLPPNNLPVQPTSFIGREREVAELKALLEKSRLVTITGSGGSGKTRLSLEAAIGMLPQFPDGVWLAELAPLADPELVPQAVATVLAIRETPWEPIAAALLSALKEKKMLLILDNCEHLLEAAARLADAILRSCPGVRLLVSSREALGIAGEHAYRVPSLSLPDPKQAHTPESLSQFEAVRLFVERAVTTNREFQLTSRNVDSLASICYRLDGIPLAIELAAARVRSMTAEELGRRLDDRFRILTGGSRTALPRQQTLRAMIDWSYNLLEENQRTLLCRLSVFAGGWTLEASESVCAGDGVEDWEVLDLLTALADKSLVLAEDRDGATRYRLLETVRQYARDRLAESDESEAFRDRHRDHFLAFAESAERSMSGPDMVKWLDRLEVEHDNLRYALEWGIAPAEGDSAALRLAGAIWRFWMIRGYFTEGRDRLARSLSPNPDRRSSARVKALAGAGVLAMHQADYPAARERFEESLDILREIGDRRGIALALGNLGNVAIAQGDNSAAGALYEESQAIFQELGDARGITASLNNLGSVACNLGDYASARALYEDCLIARRELGDMKAIADTLHNLGAVAKALGEYSSARGLYEESLAIRRELGDRRGIALSLGTLGNVELGLGRTAAAQALHEESRAIFQELGDRLCLALSLNNLGRVACGQGKLPAAKDLHARSLEMRRELSDRSGIVDSLEGIADVVARDGEWVRAARLWGAADSCREEMASPIEPGDRESYNRTLDSARQALGNEAFAAAWKGGSAMTMEQAIETALESAALPTSMIGR